MSAAKGSKENDGPLLNRPGDLIMQDKGITEVLGIFLALAFTGKVCSQAPPVSLPNTFFFKLLLISKR